VEEVVRYCPATRQTLLFSATMTAGVEELSKLSLRRPVRVKTSAGGPTDGAALAPRLIQEFVRVRREDEREAMLAALVCRNFSKRSIVFFETKKAAHRFYVILMLLKIKACELHGDMPQTLRYGSLQSFRQGMLW
jgi:ATP-dependent RNA helicase DDX27